MSGGQFLLSDTGSDPQLIPEDLGEEPRAVARTVDEFWRRDVAPALPALERHDYAVARRLLRQAGALGLTAMQIPERFGGLALDLPSLMLAIEHLAEDPSYLGWHLGQSGLGAVPLVYYGTDALRQRYLPRIAAGELITAFALTEPDGGSDALAARTRADLSAHGREYVLNGQKAWITNGGAADLFTVFAKVAGEHFTAFLVERGAGVRTGAEERKMGLLGTSTTAVYLDNVRVPATHVIGEVGRGHVVALTALNAARLEMGPICLRGAKRVITASTDFARSRIAGGRPIAERGVVQEKLADMAVRLFAAESAAWRAIGLVEAARRRSDRPHEQADAAALDAHAVECAIVKVHASEMLDRVADEGVQIHGGYGFHRDYLVERAYRDARVNRIFEGTNEVNRLAIVNLLLRRSARGQLALFETADAAASGDQRQTSGFASQARRLALGALRLSHERYGESLRDEQEIVMRLADLVIETFVLQAAFERARILTERGHPTAQSLASLYAHAITPRLERAASEINDGVSGRSDIAAVRRAIARGLLA